MKTRRSHGNDRIRLAAIAIVSLLVIMTGAAYSLMAFANGDSAGGAAGALIALTILLFAVFVFMRGNRDMRKGFPLKDERSRKVVERASSKAFYVSLYMLLAVGFLSDGLISFRDVSQATSISVGIMAVLFAAFWAYYNRKAM